MLASVSNIFVINVGRRMDGKTCAKDVYVGGDINTREWSDARQSACPARLRSSIWVRSATPAPSRSHCRSIRDCPRDWLAWAISDHMIVDAMSITSIYIILIILMRLTGTNVFREYGSFLGLRTKQ
jgi:hypothetical protein